MKAIDSKKIEQDPIFLERLKKEGRETPVRISLHLDPELFYLDELLRS